jgi:hypothetical protein
MASAKSTKDGSEKNGLLLENLKKHFAPWFLRNLPECAYGFAFNNGILKVSLRPPNKDNPKFRAVFTEFEGLLKGFLKDPTVKIAYDIK